MGSKPRIGVLARRMRLAHQQRLAPASLADSPLEVARAMTALHATDPASVYLSAAARLRQPSVEAIEDALYKQRTLVRMLGMRRTMFVVPSELASVVQAACTRAIAAQQRTFSHQLLSTAGVAEDAAAWLVALEDATMAALKKRGEATAQELGQDVPELRTQILMAEGKSYSAMQGIATRVLLLLSADGRVIRGQPRGSWISSQYPMLVADLRSRHAQ